LEGSGQATVNRFTGLTARAAIQEASALLHSGGALGRGAPKRLGRPSSSRLIGTGKIGKAAPDAFGDHGPGHEQALKVLIKVGGCIGRQTATGTIRPQGPEDGGSADAGALLSAGAPSLPRRRARLPLTQAQPAAGPGQGEPPPRNIPARLGGHLRGCASWHPAPALRSPWARGTPQGWPEGHRAGSAWPGSRSCRRPRKPLGIRPGRWRSRR